MHMRIETHSKPITRSSGGVGKERQVEKVFAPPAPHWVGDGFRVHTFFPGGELGMKRMSPFFLMDYNIRMPVAPSKQPRGVGVHPHRGFETVTISYRGKVAHHDSFGNSGVIEEGDIQWMTAGSGLLHKEYYEKQFNEKGGEFHVVQLWLNLPAKHKMTPPKYQGIVNSLMGRYVLPDNKGVVEVMAGKFHNVKGPASSFTPVEMYNLRLKKGAELKMDFFEKYNTGMLVVEGRIRINGNTVADTDRFVLFKNQGTEIILNAEEDCVVLVLSGEPIDEPVVAYGPFLMNTNEEIQQAFRDLKDGKFGFLDD
jgi:quercetin 2,3-dioxygenase